MDMDVDEQDTQFTALPSRVQRRIDRAFDSVAPRSTAQSENNVGSIERSGDSAPAGPSQPGGFIAEPLAGGFIVDNADGPAPGDFDEEETEGPDPQDRLPLSLIPSALQLLDLQPDDEDVLSVFRNAASGWNDRDLLRLQRQPDEELFVSRRDWRAVCAVLLDTSADDVAEDSGPGFRPDDVIEEDMSSGEEYVEPGDEEESEPADDDADSDDEYMEGGFVKPKAKPKAGAKRKGARKASTKASSPLSEADDDQPRPLTARQKEECRRAFRLFFPGVRDEDVDKQKIMIKDITRVAKLLGEKITADETIEMLDAFSSSADKSMGLGDFERMMIAAKLA
ncbi:hypothetical protein OBBRIDRAFT_759836, partial [Obba rivulosa]